MATDSKLRWPILILPFIKAVSCSVGDNSPFYNNCVKNCKVQVCDSGKHSIFQYNIIGFSFSPWSCLENCEYECQWKTVEFFQRKDWAIPQFKGKWPFIRLFGCQEPASVFFSLLHVYTDIKFLTLFRKEVPKSAPFYYVWNVFGLIQLNSWIWSIAFHSRDTDFTERMDYISAFFVVLASLYTVGLKFVGTSLNVKTLFWSTLCGSVALNHFVYLWLYDFDYGYNMKLNLFVGGTCVFGWILWSVLHFNRQPYVWKIFLFAALVALFACLELIDFPPILWLVDAHSLWHAVTIIPTVFLYLFAIDDCKYMLSDATFVKMLPTHKKR